MSCLYPSPEAVMAILGTMPSIDPENRLAFVIKEIVNPNITAYIFYDQQQFLLGVDLDIMSITTRPVVVHSWYVNMSLEQYVKLKKCFYYGYQYIGSPKIGLCIRKSLTKEDWSIGIVISWGS